jgi:hypothetical protein
MGKIYQIKISLDTIKPLIWRRVLVKDEITLRQLHQIIQNAMGWENVHLYSFSYLDYWFGNQAMLDDLDMMDDSSVKLNAILKKLNDQFSYEYDFGDSWQHSIKLEKILDLGPEKTPICTAGKRNCPPEDCGGNPGYFYLLDSRKKNNGGDFDPEYFNLDETNARLKKRSRRT